MVHKSFLGIPSIQMAGSKFQKQKLEKTEGTNMWSDAL